MFRQTNKQTKERSSQTTTITTTGSRYNHIQGRDLGRHKQQLGFSCVMFSRKEIRPECYGEISVLFSLPDVENEFGPETSLLFYFSY